MVARVSRSVRVLLVEDNEGDAELLRQRLSWSDLDADLTRVQTLSEMIHALEGKSWDVVVCDYHLPAFDARDALAGWRSITRRCPSSFSPATCGKIWWWRS